MDSFLFSDVSFPVREDLTNAYRDYWKALAGPGSWWTGHERIAIAQETRNALSCLLCRKRKRALSPYSLDGEHRHTGQLSTVAIDAVHRIITDQARITRQYIEDNVSKGLSKEAYVELVGVATTVFSIDEFHRALGIEVEPLPVPRPGDPDHYRPPKLRDDIGFVPTIPPDGNVGKEADLWDGVQAANVIRALSLVPQALRDWRNVAYVQYLPFERLRNFDQDEERDIDRLQMELIASRVSAINECFY